MLQYLIMTVIALIGILLALTFMVGRQTRVKPIDRMMNAVLESDTSGPEKDGGKQVRWSYKLSSYVFRKKETSSKADPYRALLAQADLEMTSEEFLLIRLLFTAALGFIGYSMGRNLIVGLISGVLTWFIPRLFLHFRILDKRKRFDAQLLDAISIISNSLKAGYSFFQALSAVVEETPDPLSKEFKIMLKEMSFGLSVEQAFKSLLLRVYTEDLYLLTISVLIQRDIGGNLSELLENIAITIRDRQKINGELRALTAQGRLSGTVITLLPVALIVAMYFVNRDYIMLLFTSKVGNVMLVVSGVLILIGSLIVNKITKIEL